MPDENLLFPLSLYIVGAWNGSADVVVYTVVSSLHFNNAQEANFCIYHSKKTTISALLATAETKCRAQCWPLPRPD